MTLRKAFLITLWFVAILWVIQVASVVFSLDLARFGVYPGKLSGLMGVLFAPLIHGSFSHIFSNTLPLLVLGTATLVGYPRSSKFVIPIIYLGTGLLVWFFGRPSFHIGSSGLNFGLLAFTFVVGALRWDTKAIALSCLVFFMYGSMIWGIFPTTPGVSFESHFFGAVTGVLCAIVFRNYDPKPPQKRYSWEEEGDEAALDDEDNGPTLTGVGLTASCIEIAHTTSTEEKNEIFVETISSTAAGIAGGFAVGLCLISNPVGWGTAIVLAVGSVAASYGVGKAGRWGYDKFGQKVDFVNGTGVGSIWR